MIEISPTAATMLYLGLTISILLGLWIYQQYRFQRKKILPAEQKLLICEFCHFAYLEDQAKNVTRCPQCQSFNKNNSYKSSKSI